MIGGIETRRARVSRSFDPRLPRQDSRLPRFADLRYWTRVIASTTIWPAGQIRTDVMDHAPS